MNDQRKSWEAVKKLDWEYFGPRPDANRAIGRLVVSPTIGLAYVTDVDGLWLEVSSVLAPLTLTVKYEAVCWIREGLEPEVLNLHDYLIGDNP